MRSNNQRFHDHFAARYDAHYEGDALHRLQREIQWRHLKRFLPKAAGAAVLDAGCGTGHYGLKLAKSGYAVDFLDLSRGMLDQAEANHRALKVAHAPRFVQADLGRPDGLPPAHYALIVAEGDVLSFVADPQAAARAVAGLLAGGGTIVASLDQRYAGLEHYCERGDLGALERFCADGRSEWLAARKDERFETRMFTPAGARALFEGAGLEVVSMIGRLVLPLRRHRRLLDDEKARRRLIELEEKLHADPAALGLCAHLEVAARKPG